MTRFLRLLSTVALAAATTAFAQTTPPPGGQARRAEPPPSNLQVLPKDLTTQQVEAIMHTFTGGLGVRCNFCHASDAATGRLNFASDANPMKNRARVMIKMTRAINTEYLTQLSGPAPQNPVTCGTCHRGMSEPSVFTPAPRERPSGPPPAAPPAH